jgi:hypothetical protein
MIMTVIQETEIGNRSAGPIDIDTCMPWNEEGEVVDTESISSSKTGNASKPFSSLKRLLKKAKRSKRTKKDGGEDTSISSGSTGGKSSFSLDEDEASVVHEEKLKSPLLKNTDTTGYDTRPISESYEDELFADFSDEVVGNPQNTTGSRLILLNDTVRL